MFCVFCPIQLFTGNRTTIDSTYFQTQLRGVLQNANPGLSSSIVFSASYLYQVNRDSYWLPYNLTIANGNAQAMKDAISTYVSQVSFNGSIIRLDLGVRYGGVISTGFRPQTITDQPSSAPTVFRSATVTVYQVSDCIELHTLNMYDTMRYGTIRYDTI